MNIFSVLNQGSSRLHEPSISAMLGYLLSPKGDHGLGVTFLKAFIELINRTKERNIIKKLPTNGLMNTNMELESDYNNKYIDIQLSIFNNNSKETHRIIIENKIKVGAANPKQLVEYYNAVIKDKDFQIDSPDLTIVFLTPESENHKLKLEYNNLKNIIDGKHNCAWVSWSIEESNDCVLGIIKEVLTKELNADINPINEYMRHTLKAFVQHTSSVTAPQIGDRKMRTGDIGNIVDEVIITTSDKIEHRIIRRDSSQIQVYNVATEEKEIARHIMSHYIDENNLDINHKKLNTRMIGKKLLGKLLVK